MAINFGKLTAGATAEGADASATDTGESAPEVVMHHYTCLPIARYVIQSEQRTYEFTNGHLALDTELAADFEATMAKQPLQEQARIRKLSHGPAAERPLFQMVQGIDHTGNALDAPGAVPQA